MPQYSKSEINRNLEAATLQLSTYDWNFDIVPCFITVVDESINRNYYIIPDGYGNWKKTDPRRDRDKVSKVNQAHDGNILNVIRAVKYWNRRPIMPSMGSYLIETMIVYYYENKATKAGAWVDIEVKDILGHITSAVWSSVSDPTGDSRRY